VCNEYGFDEMKTDKGKLKYTTLTGTNILGDRKSN